MRPLVSILIPAYNAESWIGDTLKSAVAQSWPRTEVIVVNDGSTDGTLAAARRFESTTVKIFTQENRGAAATRNKAYELCQGDFIQWLDADDLLSVGKIAHQMELVGQSGSKRTLVSCPWGSFMYRYHRARFVPSLLWCDRSPTEWLLCKMSNNLHMQTGTWIVSRELTDSAGPWNTSLLGDDDGEYFCRVLLQSDGVRFVPESKVYYRAAGSASLSYIGRSDRKLQAQWLSMQLHIGYLRSLEDSERSRGACVRYLQTWLTCFHPERPDIVQQMQELTAQLGGSLNPPALSWKYSWIDMMFGRKLAKEAGILLPRMKWSFLRSMDKALFNVNRRHVPSPDALC